MNKIAKSEKRRAVRSGFLEHLFGSRTRVKLLRLFLRNPGRQFFVRELSREVGSQLNAVRRELDRFLVIKLLRTGSGNDDPRYPKKKFYTVDEHAPLYEELRSLVFRAHFFAGKEMVEEFKSIGKVSAIYFCGIFANDFSALTDILLVGRFDRGKLKVRIDKLGAEVGFDIRYTVLTPSEFKYRRDVADRFLLGILDGHHYLGYNVLPQLPESHDQKL